MAKIHDIPLEELIGDAVGVKEPGYDEWALAKIEAAVKYNREHPDDWCTLQDMRKKYGL